MSYSNFLERVGSKAKITGKNGNIQRVADDQSDYVKSPMIKSLRSREIPLITRKWKEKRKVKIWDVKTRSDLHDEYTTESIIKTAQKLKPSSPTCEKFNLELLNAALLKVKNDKKGDELQTTSRKDITSHDQSVNKIEDDAGKGIKKDDRKNNESSVSISDPDISDADIVKNKAIATEMEILVADHIYPGVKWTVDTLFNVSNLIAPALKHWNPTTFVDFSKRKRLISPEILKLYNSSSFPRRIITEKLYSNGDEMSNLDHDLEEESIQILETSTETGPNSLNLIHSKNLFPAITPCRHITAATEKKISTAETLKSKSIFNKGQTPFQIQKHIQAKKFAQYSFKTSSTSITDTHLESPNEYHKKDQIPDSNKVTERNPNDNNQVPRISASSDSEKYYYRRNSSPVESIAQSCVSSNRPVSSILSMDRASFLSRNKNKFLPVKLGRLGPDKDNEAYREQLEKKHRQLEYAEQIRKSLADKVHKKIVSRPSSASEHIILPQILINYSAENVARGLEKRNRMKEYAQSIKKPQKTYIQEGGLPEIPNKKISLRKDLHQMEKDHASSMLEVLNIRRQLNL